MKDFMNILNNRKNTKEFNPSIEIPKEDIENIISLAQKSPSSWNLQHWKFVIFDSKTSKKKLFPISYNQKAILDSSVTIAILADTEADKNFDYVYDPLVGKSLSKDIRDRLKNQVSKSFDDEEWGVVNSYEDAFINSAMCAITLVYAAEYYNYDTGIIGGFSREDFKEEFSISNRYIPLVLIPIGRKSDYPHESTRFKLKNSTIWL